LDDKFKYVIAVRQRSHRSWTNLRNAIYKEQGKQYCFGTLDVERTSISYLKKAIEESGLSLTQILEIFDEKQLGL
jgi:hypothetical protein